MTSVTEIALSFEGVTHRYKGLLAVNSLSFEIGAREIVCLVGPSGSGKSTILRLAAGLEELQAGSISSYGVNVSKVGSVLIAPENREVGFVFQDLALFPHLTVVENITFGMQKGGKRQQNEEALELLRGVGLEGYSNAYPHMLSGGEQQRVALVRALAPKPRLVLLDEPFSDLDTRLRADVRRDTLRMLKAAKTPVLLVTHDLGEAMLMADRLIVVNHGELVQQGHPEAIYDQPKNRFVAELLSGINVLHCTVNNGYVQSPLGEVSASGFASGAEVELVIRNEALSLSTPENDQGTMGKVAGSRTIGHYSVVNVTLEGYQASLTAHVPTATAPRKDAKVRVDFDRRLAYVFARNSV